MKLIKREKYLSAIRSRLGRNMIVCITGQRRVGKTSILRTLKQSLEQGNSHSIPGEAEYRRANVIFIDKEKSEFDAIINYTDLNDYISVRLDPDSHNYLLIDEVQDIEGFERSLANFYDREDMDIVVTGSNAKMFSGELATLLSGRYLPVHVGSLSYAEFLEFHALEDSDLSLSQYLNIGGMPNLALIPVDNTEAINDYLRSIYSTIVLKDLVIREGIRNVPFLENLTRYVADNIGKLFSANNIANFMAVEKEKVPATTVKNYLRSLCNAYIINKVERWDIHGKQLLTTNEKYYFEDLGLRNILTSGQRRFDIEKLIENAVYLHLKGMGYTVNVGALRAGEVDFVASKGTERAYIQVTYLLASQETFDREYGSLLAIKDNYPKYLISMDPLHSTGTYEGVQHIPLRKFLLSESLP